MPDGRKRTSWGQTLYLGEGTKLKMELRTWVIVIVVVVSAALYVARIEAALSRQSDKLDDIKERLGRVEAKK